MTRKLTSLAASHDGLSPALLSRARSITDEHETLAKKVAADYDAKSAKRLGQLSGTAAALKDYDDSRSAFKELQDLLKSPDKELRELAEEDVEPSRERIQQSS